MSGKKLSAGTKLGYSVGTFGDNVPLNIFNFYFLFFLTDIAGVSPVKAGMVSSIAVLWNAVMDPIVGYASDNSRSKYGRRRSFMMKSIIPYGICMFLIFSDIALPAGIKVIFCCHSDGVLHLLYVLCNTVFRPRRRAYGRF